MDETAEISFTQLELSRERWIPLGHGLGLENIRLQSAQRDTLLNQPHEVRRSISS
jgi:hypothetical protein